METEKIRKKRVEWNDRFYLETYLLRRDGTKSVHNVASALGVSEPAFAKWLRDKPALREAWERAAEDGTGRGCAGSLKEFIYNRMDPKLKRVWDQIIEEGGVDGGPRVEAILAGKPTRVRQHLFIHALTCTSYNVSRAASMVNISMAGVKKWYETDPVFADLIEEIEEHKINFFEGRFIDLVVKGEPSAVIHAIKTKGRGRGYGEQKQVAVQVNGQIDVNHTHVDITQLDLPVDVLRVVLDAMRAKMDRDNVPRLPGTAKVLTQAVTTNVMDDDDDEAEDD